MRAGIQDDFIFHHFPGFRVSPNPVSSMGQAPYRAQGRLAGLARNDSFFGMLYSLSEGDAQWNFFEISSFRNRPSLNTIGIYDRMH